MSAKTLPVTSKNSVPTGGWRRPSCPGVEYGIVPQIHSSDAKGCGNELVVTTNLQLSSLKHLCAWPAQEARSRHSTHTHLIELKISLGKTLTKPQEPWPVYSR